MTELFVRASGAGRELVTLPRRILTTSSRRSLFLTWKLSRIVRQHSIRSLVYKHRRTSHSDHTYDCDHTWRFVNTKQVAQYLGKEWLHQVRMHAGHRRVELHAQKISYRAEKRCEEAEDKDSLEYQIGAEPS